MNAISEFPFRQQGKRNGSTKSCGYTRLRRHDPTDDLGGIAIQRWRLVWIWVPLALPVAPLNRATLPLAVHPGCGKPTQTFGLPGR
jgi:hypothetical protein